ncbi:hypothetical protein EV714DRAFT_256070 [Schizophyllum commune]
MSHRSRSQRESRQRREQLAQLRRDGQPKPADCWECPDCHGWFQTSRNGAGNHQRRCPAREEPLSSQTPSSGFSVLAAHNRTLAITTTPSAPGPLVFPVISDAPKRPSSSTSTCPESHPHRNKRQRRREQSVGLVDSSSESESDDMSDFSMSGDSDSTTDNEELPARLDDGQLYIKNHPGSLLRNVKYYPDDEPPVPPILPHSFENEAPPWCAFGTRENFEQAELFIRYGCTNSYVDQQLALNHRASDGKSNVTMRTSHELHAILRDLSAHEGYAQFTKVDITVEYPRDSEAARTYSVYQKPILPIIHQILEDDTLRDRLHLYPQQRFVARAGGGIMRMWDEVSSGDDWYALQDELDSGTFAICLQVYIDATHVTPNGNVKYWPMHLWLSNVPKADRNDTGGLGGASLVGLIPIVEGKPTDTSSQLALHRAGVYQQSLAAVFEGLSTAIEFGTYVNVAVTHGAVKGHVICIIVSCDYEEMCRAAGIKGPRSRYTCPMCLVPHNLLWNLNLRHEKRTIDATLALLEEADAATTQQDKKDILNRQSLRPVKNTLIELFGQYISVFDMFIADPLHQIEQGEWGRHWWPWLLNVLPDRSLDLLDESFKACSRYPNVHHFRNGITELKYITGDEQGQVLHRIIPFLVGLLPEHETDILRTLRALAVIHMLCASFTIHTEETLEWLDDAVRRYAHATQIIREGLGIKFEWPKHHALVHLTDIIRRKGPVDNYETGLGERLHPQIKRDYRRSSKRPSTVTDELIWMAQERECILRVRAQVDRYDAYVEMLAEEARERDRPDASTGAELPDADLDSDNGRLKLSAPNRHLICIATFLHEHAEDIANPVAALRRLAQALRPSFNNQRIPDDELEASTVRPSSLMSQSLLLTSLPSRRYAVTAASLSSTSA